MIALIKKPPFVPLPAKMSRRSAPALNPLAFACKAALEPIGVSIP
jgi:hypothetical protein